MSSVVHEHSTSRIFDLEDRTYMFAKHVRAFLRKLPNLVLITDDCRQLIRSSGSIGANYLESQEALGKKDFVMRIKICLKEAKESVYWLSLMEDFIDSSRQDERRELVREAHELQRIFGSAMRTIRSKK